MKTILSTHLCKNGKVLWKKESPELTCNVMLAHKKVTQNIFKKIDVHARRQKREE